MMGGFADHGCGMALPLGRAQGGRQIAERLAQQDHSGGIQHGGEPGFDLAAEADQGAREFLAAGGN
jgi:hypothetical protein